MTNKAYKVLFLILFLLENVDSLASPTLRSLQVKNLSHGCSYVYLQNGICYFSSLFHTFTPDDKRSLYLIQGVASVASAFMSVVGGKDEDAVVIEPSLLHSIEDLRYLAVAVLHRSIVFVSATSKAVSGMIHCINVDEADYGFLLLDVLHALRHNGLGVFRGLVDFLVVVQAEGIGIVLEATPFAYDTQLGIGTFLTHQVEEGGLSIVLSH